MAEIDDEAIRAREDGGRIATNDAVAGETVWPGTGEGNRGPTGGAPREETPEYARNDLAGTEVDLEDEVPFDQDDERPIVEEDEDDALVPDPERPAPEDDEFAAYDALTDDAASGRDDYVDFDQEDENR